jgi:neurofibromin 1
MIAALADPSQLSNNLSQFTDQLGKVAQSPNKLRDVSVVCILDLCRGAARARPDPGKDLPIHANVSDYIHEVLVSS